MEISLSQTDLLQTLKQLGSPRVIVFGDMILDRYTTGDTERISQEAPILVLQAKEREARLGGAANVCNMLRALEAEVTAVGIVGADESGKTLRKILQESDVDCTSLLEDTTRPTTVKERFVGRVCGLRPGQILRVDHEATHPLSLALGDRLLEALTEKIKACDVVLISDYAKGVCTPHVTKGLIQLARQHKVPILVDPLRGGDYQHYTGATLIKPNRTESETCLGRKIQTTEDALEAGSRLCDQLDVNMVVLTLDRDGMALVRRDGNGRVFPTRARSVYDVTGAGDMVLAMLGVCFGANMTSSAAVQLANLAAGLEVEKPGVAVISKQEIEKSMQTGLRSPTSKIQTLPEAAEQATRHRQQGQRIVFTNGCFDLLHAGHVSYLAEARALGDILVVGMNSDDSVRRLKGPQRPINQEADRAAVLAALECIDYVVPFSEETPHNLLHEIRPDVLVKGGTYCIDDVVGKEVVEAYGGQVCVTGALAGKSTTNILKAATDRAA
ncbi:MAG: D-glycero-beta-D-manno-heptose 1-phosphate adenylyltransferase [Pirellulaceae bacterium]|nr:D-glycero-beta-D-manno-heptose 1-phosphate adenylyltransferase [Pirellulaceae bacterium]